jgi:hypothetical protein
MVFKIQHSANKYYWIYLTETYENYPYVTMGVDSEIAHYLNLSQKEYSQILYGCNALYAENWGLMFSTIEDAEQAILLLEPHLILVNLTR